MCYSARVEQNAKRLARMLKGKVDVEAYAELFKRRLKGEKLYIGKGLEETFLKDAETPKEKTISQEISQWHKQQVTALEAELFKQKTRLNGAEKALKTKATKKAENDQRIATKKIEKIQQDLKRHNNLEKFSDSDSRIFPLHYLSVLTLNSEGEKIVTPMRYLMRPHNKDASFDFKFNGCYNARFDSLERVGWWKDSLEKRRGLALVKRFYENVSTEDYLKNNKLDKESAERANLVICFEPDNIEYMYVPVIWDVWKKKGEEELVSCALITDDPLPEIAAAGHDRTPIFIKPEAVDAWLSANSIEDAVKALNERELPHYSHAVQGVAS